jgi:hypothetical protein
MSIADSKSPDTIRMTSESMVWCPCFRRTALLYTPHMPCLSQDVPVTSLNEVTFIILFYLSSDEMQHQI